MYICLVCKQVSNEQWKVICLPVTERKNFSTDEWKERLVVTDNSRYPIYVSTCSVSLYELNRIVGELQPLYSIVQIQDFIKKCRQRLSIKWSTLTINEPSQRQHDRQVLADVIWEKVSGTIRGRLLHLYELQKCLNKQSSPLTLEQVTDCLVVWAWQDKIELLSGIAMKRSRLLPYINPYGIKMSCRRCANMQLEHASYICYSCKDQCISCTQCTQLGKVRSCSILIKTKYVQQQMMVKRNPIDIDAIINRYQLSSAQTEAVQQLLAAITSHYEQAHADSKKKTTAKAKKLNYILWAVTGAGKTEMIFPLIHLFLLLELKVLIAIPRRDVVQELQPRISKAFYHCKVVALYGGSEQVWDNGHIYIATTHQVIRFEQYFDLVILDEMDAFPYYNNATLIRTLERVQTPNACFVQLTATIPAKEKMKMKLGQQKHVKVPVRYHQKPLPIPQFKQLPSLISIIQSKQLPLTLCHIIEQSYERGAVLFIFLQRKVYLQPFTDLLSAKYPHIALDCTSAEDEQREQKVKLFRERKLQLLVTTSILERGVTIKKSDICILDVHQKAFNRTAIVQMSGRAGRNIEDTNGYVYLLGIHKTKDINAAIKEIKAMNALAKQKGYLKEDD